MNKYVIRRAVLSVFALPVLAFVYVAGYAILVGLGAEPTTTVQGAWANGFILAGAVGAWFTADAWESK